MTETCKVDEPSHSAGRRRSLMFAALVGIGALWSLTIPLNKIAVSAGHAALGLVLWQLVIIFIVLAGLVAMRRVHPRVNRAALAYVMLIGVLGTALPHGASFIAVSRLPASEMAVIIATVPMFAFGIASVLGVERVSARRLLGTALGMIAIVSLFAGRLSAPDASTALFVGVGLIAPLCYALEGIAVATRNRNRLDPISTLLGASATGILLVAPLVWLTGSGVSPMGAWGPQEWALTGSALIHVASYAGYIWLITATGTVFASQIAYLVTLGAVISSMLLLGEPASINVFVALTMVLLGIWLTMPISPHRIPTSRRTKW